VTEQTFLKRRPWLAETSRTLMSAADSRQVMRIVAREACLTARCDRSLVLRWDEPNGRGAACAGYGFPEQAMKPARGDITTFFSSLEESWNARQGVLLGPGPLADRLTSRRSTAQGSGGMVLAYPLSSQRFGTLGAVLLDRENGYGAADLADLHVVADFTELAALALGHALLFEQSGVLASLTARARLAADLHDGVAQELFAARLDADELGGYSGLPAEAAIVLDRLTRRLGDATRELRAALHGISQSWWPPEDDCGQSLGVVDLVRDRLDEFRTRSDVSVNFDVRGVGPEPAVECRDVLVRAVREGLANVLKHANATQVTVALRRGVMGWAVRVDDDGTGRAPDVRRILTLPEAESFGLPSLAAEAVRLGGRFRVSAAPGLGGVSIGVWVPDEAHHRASRPG
jgi:signal transduction histidine kinase